MNSTTKQKFVADYEIKASVKMLYPYIYSASGLAQWFADDVKVDNEKKLFTFYWENEAHLARLTAHRLNHFAKFEFLSDDAEEEVDPSYLELRLEQNELTQTVFLHIVDYSDFDDLAELKDLWNGLVDTLKSTVGG
ncbi:MAG TPA: START-like domain-containing protein [Cyclobacteriaceae bacterium]|nr:START-like domain-containing protein [Cyclobacteriaceae bacterium]